MKKVKIIKISDQEKEELKSLYDQEKPENLTFDQLLESNENHTLSILKQMKNIYEWKDIEKMVDYVAVLKKFKNEKSDYVELDKDEYALTMEVFQESVASGKIQGHAMEKLVQIYQEFKNAS